MTTFSPDVLVQQVKPILRPEEYAEMRLWASGLDIRDPRVILEPLELVKERAKEILWRRRVEISEQEWVGAA